MQQKFLVFVIIEQKNKGKYKFFDVKFAYKYKGEG